MVECDRCGNSGAMARSFHSIRKYCDDCHNRLDEIAESGIVVAQGRQRSVEGAPHVFVIVDNVQDEQENRRSVEDALERAIELTESHDCHGIVKFPETDGKWILSNYLDARPEIAEKVHSSSNSNESFLSRLLGA